MSYLLKVIFGVGGAIAATAVVVMMLVAGISESILGKNLSDKLKQIMVRTCVVILLIWMIVGLCVIYSLLYSVLATGGS